MILVRFASFFSLIMALLPVKQQSNKLPLPKNKLKKQQSTDSNSVTEKCFFLLSNRNNQSNKCPHLDTSKWVANVAQLKKNSIQMLFCQTTNKSHSLSAIWLLFNCFKMCQMTQKVKWLIQLLDLISFHSMVFTDPKWVRQFWKANEKALPWVGPPNSKITGKRTI